MDNATKAKFAGLKAGTGDPDAPVEETDVAKLSERMFTTEVPASQATPEVSTGEHQLIYRGETIRGGRLAVIPFDTYLPDELAEPVKRWRATLQAADDADVAVTVAKNKLHEARKAAVEREVEGSDEPMPDFNALRAEVDECEIRAEAKVRLAARETAQLESKVGRAYPGWRAYVLERFDEAESNLREAIAKMRQAETVRDDMMRAVMELDALIGAKSRPMATRDGTPTRHHLTIGVRAQINGAVERRARALTDYMRDLLRPDTFDWTPKPTKAPFTTKAKAKTKTKAS